MYKLSPDQPCKGEKPEEEDSLGYYPFAKTLADAIYNSTPDDGLVMALYGAWGSGKSTLLNFVEHALTEKGDSVQVVRFNPWWFSGRENLTRDLIGQLRSAFSLSLSRNLTEQLKLVFSSGKREYIRIGRLLQKYQKHIQVIGTIADLTCHTAGFGKLFNKLIAKLANAATKPTNITQLKEDISKILRQSRQKILVLVDDIDRLNPDEIHELFTVIKALADFPNVIYLMAFDKQIVCSALKNKLNFKNNDGERFLQKIVQVEFVMPLIDRAKMSDMLIGRLQEIIEASLYDEQYQEYWSEVYKNMRFLFETPRDIFRFINAFSVTYPAVKENVNPVDFIAIEAIRVFNPELYFKIKDFPSEFTKDRPDDSCQPAMSADDMAHFRQNWEKRILGKNKRNVVNLVKIIFPRLSTNDTNKDERKQYANDLRICHPKILPVYFKFNIPDSMVTKAEIETLFSNSSEEIVESLLLYKNSNEGKLTQAIEILSQVIDDIPLENIHCFVDALFDVGDQLIIFSNIWFFWDIINLSVGLIQRMLIFNKNEAAEKIINAISDGEAFTVPILTISELLSRFENKKNYDEIVNFIYGDVKNSLHKKFSKIKQEPYWLPQQMPAVFKASETLGWKTEIIEYCKKQIDSDEHILNFFHAYLNTNESDKPQDYILIFEKLYGFIDFRQCINNLNKIKNKKGLSPNDKKILEDLERAEMTTGISVK